MGNPVTLHVYELTRGLARSMSMMLLGRQIEGVWHTGIVVYGKEYFYGSHGISYVPAGSFSLGAPDELVNLGETHIPEDLFKDYLAELQRDTFAGSKYHLFNHNCNNFSNEAAMFLTGNSIPARIVNLPNEVLSTPFGQMMLPMIDSMMAQFDQAVQANTENIQNDPTPNPTLTTAKTPTATQAQQEVAAETKKSASSNEQSTETQQKVDTKTEKTTVSSEKKDGTSSPQHPQNSNDSEKKKSNDPKNPLHFDLD
ncbi:PPPDE putative peptidase domain-containing protein [Ditylenchus destructor]|uniref:PPPDE putative peptidase domain-containing protein n=1 Tax=Ditylenchus destructor TaxID=166010 RepID=A0AAD4NB32_9BILA|nr:PPPDE putative peptidase domain-containing protein [Ditylenchus destructor]